MKDVLADSGMRLQFAGHETFPLRQASEAVMTMLADKIGEEYILTRHNSSDGASKEPEFIEARGKTYNLTTYNSEIEGTRITWVKQ